MDVALYGPVNPRKCRQRPRIWPGKGTKNRFNPDIQIMRTNLATVLDPNRRSNDAGEFEAALRRKIVGQDQAIDKVAEIYQMFLAGLNAPGRPVGNLLFLGPTRSTSARRR